VSSATSPLNVTTPLLLATVMWRTLMRSSVKNFDWMADVTRASFDSATAGALASALPLVATAPGVPAFCARAGTGATICVCS
jgi:hypothetical protein